ncbi:MAG: DUF368 domain-containing protein [Bacteroidota bacterium]
MKDGLLLFLKGIAMGGADIIPGVSGGTIAFITGIYERLINAIKSVDVNALVLLKQFEFKKLWEHIDGNFLAILFAGIAVSVASLARLMTYLLHAHPIQLWSFFFGLILISAFVVARSVKNWKTANFLGLILGVVLAYFITSATPAETPEGYWFIFVSGAIAICAMILPGISGSFILLILGKYQFILEGLKNFDLTIISIFMLGCVVGILSFSRLISWLLTHYHDVTVAILAGFMIGSLNKIWPWKEVLQFRLNSKGEQVPFIERNLLPAEYLEVTGGDPYLLQAILFGALGFFLVFAIEFINRALHPKNKKYA